ncbi:MAG: hypothetical protein JNK41_11655 [Saprospiraceae bacterium]|nr:hypothetical protein [Saprospiraceae bacterium]
MTDFEKILSGGDLRSIGKSNSLILKIQTQKDFDELFQCLFHEDRLVVMRAADTVEKIAINNTQFLKKHKEAIIKLCNVARDKELKWHLALLIPRLQLDKSEFGKAWNTLTIWAKDRSNSRIVRVNSIQGLSDMKQQEKELEKDFSLTLSEIEKENIPSINARIRQLKNVSR